ncbi:MAG: phospho-N-acetylmuramoyl-pentapeptide-transferase, partial [Actinomycetota bacterium]
MIAILTAAAVSMIASLIGTRLLMSFFKRLGKGQPILGAEDRGPVQHIKKQGTPTMGGIAIMFSAAFGWIVAHFRDGLPFSDQAMIIWAAVFVLGFVGF